MIRQPQPAFTPITVDPHFSPAFYGELWGVSASTVLRWFQDLPGVLKLNPSGGRGEIRIPYSLAMTVYAEKCK